MSFSTIIVGAIIILFFFGVYSCYKKKNMVLIQYTHVDNTEEQRWVSYNKRIKMDVNIRGMQFTVLPQYVTSFFCKGGVHTFFPTRANFVRFVWYSRWPIDQKTGKPAIVSPEVRGVLNKSEILKSYVTTGSPQAPKKQGLIMQYLPIIIIVVMLLGGYYLYSSMQAQKAHMAAIEQTVIEMSK